MVILCPVVEFGMELKVYFLSLTGAAPLVIPDSIRDPCLFRKPGQRAWIPARDRNDGTLRTDLNRRPVLRHGQHTERPRSEKIQFLLFNRAVGKILGTETRWEPGAPGQFLKDQGIELFPTSCHDPQARPSSNRGQTTETPTPDGLQRR